MSKFDWQHPPSPVLRDRFPANAVGFGAWQDLIGGLSAGISPPADLFEEFLRALQNVPPVVGPAPARCCVFISHQRKDVPAALAIAKIATQEGYDYWLDVHDPVLQGITAPPGSAVYGILVAAIIEMALLNSTHVIATQTRNSAGSKWIPYELGRAKERLPLSKRAACWFAQGFSPTNCGEYTWLVIQTVSSSQIARWLKLPHQGCATSPGSLAWSGGETEDLDSLSVTLGDINP